MHLQWLITNSTKYLQTNRSEEMTYNVERGNKFKDIILLSVEFIIISPNIY